VAGGGLGGGMADNQHRHRWDGATRLSGAAEMTPAEEEQLVIDLTGRANERLVQWVKDTRDLFDMAEVGHVADYAIFMALVMGARRLGECLGRNNVHELFKIIGKQHASR
jgi:hypothetical protein